MGAVTAAQSVTGSPSSMARSHYSASFTRFLAHSETEVLGALAAATSSEMATLQRGAWVEQIRILRQVLPGLGDGHLLFEFAIPRLGKRIDNVLIFRGVVHLLEFKVGETHYHAFQREQVLDYALDLKYFHAASATRLLAPFLICTRAVPPPDQPLRAYRDGIVEPRLANAATLAADLLAVDAWAAQVGLRDPALHAQQWEDAPYAPTPTIIEAAQALYAQHDVREISRADASAVNLTETTETIAAVIHKSRRDRHKSICFVTGVPGAGKTLAGLNIANRTHSFDEEEHAVFLSGNGPLVEVLREALARDERDRSLGRISKKEAARKTSAFIQNIHHFRDAGLEDDAPPIERVVIFDEAQRAWTVAKTAAFMREKKGRADFNLSEPEFLIEMMDRHHDWAVIVCLVGGGQEINTGEAGLPEWFSALRRRFPGWRVHVSARLADSEYLQGNAFADLVQGLQVESEPALHLAVSMRSFRSEKVAELVKAILDGQATHARGLVREVLATFPMALTRDLHLAKEWVRGHARGSERTGLIASSGAHRLRPHGIWVSNEIDAPTWFLNARDDVRSSYALEMVATEFDIQGLELDWTIVAWDGDLRFVGSGLHYWSFRGRAWQQVRDDERVRYLINAYRVLLTRARQGFVLFVPRGDEADATRSPACYDDTFAWLESLGIPVLF